MARYDQCDSTCTTDCGACKGNPPKPFVADNGFNRAQAQGHMRRKGHRLVGYWATPNPKDPDLHVLVRTCCGEEPPSETKPIHDVPTAYTAPPTYETLRALWLGQVPTCGPTERYDREVNFEMWAQEHGIHPTQTTTQKG